MNPRYAINGRFLIRKATGVDRYARELVIELDKLMEPGEAVLVVPCNTEIVDPLPLNVIEIVQFGRFVGQAWEQLDFWRYARAHRLLGVNLCNTAPILDPDVVCIHDMAIRANPNYFSTKFVLWYRLLFFFITRRSNLIITVSEFSKREIEKYYPHTSGKITVIYNAWQHINRVEPNAATLNKHGLKAGEYYFAMSSLAPNKNLKWIVETARMNPEDTFVVAGGINSKVFGEHAIPEADNVVYVGYVSDGEARALMEGCKAFLYPTFYEGFGIPPMEAMACGAHAIVSDTEVMHEVYGEAVGYINPNIPIDTLDDLLLGLQTSAAETVLSRFEWCKMAGWLEEELQKTYSIK